MDPVDEWPVTNFSCSAPFCQDPIPFAEDVVVVTVHSAGYTENGLQYAPIPADDGDYLYEPCYFCADCWSQVEEELRDYTRDQPPVFDDQAAFECQVCKSGIRTGELFGVAVLGMLEMSKRCPDGAYSASFVSPEPKPLLLCISCMNVIEKDIAEMWGGRIVQCSECEEGTNLRCWRHGCSADGNCVHVHPMEIKNAE